MVTQPPPRIMILGHSFVWRIARFMAKIKLSRISDNFFLTSTPLIKCHGIGGRTALKLYQFDLSAVARFQSNVLILQIGSNDLCDPRTNVQALATNIMQLVQILCFELSVDHIIGSQILPRQNTPHCVPQYNDLVSQLTSLLYHLFKTVSFATFWSHYSISLYYGISVALLILMREFLFLVGRHVTLAQDHHCRLLTTVHFRTRIFLGNY